MGPKKENAAKKAQSVKEPAMKSVKDKVQKSTKKKESKSLKEKLNQSYKTPIVTLTASQIESRKAASREKIQTAEQSEHDLVVAILAEWDLSDAEELMDSLATGMFQSKDMSEPLGLTMRPVLVVLLAFAKLCKKQERLRGWAFEALNDSWKTRTGEKRRHLIIKAETSSLLQVSDVEEATKIFNRAVEEYDQLQVDTAKLSRPKRRTAESKKKPGLESMGPKGIAKPYRESKSAFDTKSMQREIKGIKRRADAKSNVQQGATGEGDIAIVPTNGNMFTVTLRGPRPARNASG